MEEASKEKIRIRNSRRTLAQIAFSNASRFIFYFIYIFILLLILLLIYGFLFFQRTNSQIATSNELRSPERIAVSNESRSVFFECMFVYLIAFIPGNIYISILFFIFKERINKLRRAMRCDRRNKEHWKTHRGMWFFN